MLPSNVLIHQVIIELHHESDASMASIHDCTASTSSGSATTTSLAEGDRDYSCVAEELADARLLSRAEALAAIESLTYQFLLAISKGEDPELLLVRML